MATISLSSLITKIRKLTARPSSLEITDSEITDYINLFYEYDFPFEIKDFNFKSTFTFQTQPNQDKYDLTSMIIGSSGLSPINYYKSFEPPVFVNGYESSYYQNQEDFFRMFPKLDTIETIAVADGGVGPYTGTISATPILKGSILMSAATPTGVNLLVVDNGQGQLIEANSTAITPPVIGSINYTTGSFTVTFQGVATEAGTNITAKFNSYSASRPYALLYYEDYFLMRPVPDDSYTVEISAFLKPTSFISSAPASVPTKFLNDYFQLLAYGTACKIFIDSLETESYAQLKPRLDEEIQRVERRTIMQVKTQRASTIYSDSPNYVGYRYPKS
jgi:hypothetical protein